MSDELLVALRAELEELTALVTSLPGERLERLERLERGSERTDADGWSARQVLAHLADFEVVAAVRVQMVLSLDRPPLAAYGQEAFTARFSQRETAAQALERFRVNREATLRVLEALSTEDWTRCGIHPERGEEPLRRTVEFLSRHDRMHLAQIRDAAGPEGTEQAGKL